MTPSLEFSSTYLTGLDQALRELEFRSAVLDQASKPLQLLLANPRENAWWPGELGIELICSIAKLHGAEGTKRVAIHASHQRMGPLVRPLVNVLLIIGGSTFHTLGTRANQFVSVGIKGVVTTYQALSPTSGRVIFTFPCEVPAELALMWFGFFDVAFALLKKGRVSEQTVKPAEHTFTITW